MAPLNVGSVIRAKRPASKDGGEKSSDSTGSSGRAVVAIIQDDGMSICVLWEPIAPIPIAPCTRQDFLVTPKSAEHALDDDEMETTLTLGEVHDLLPFEVSSTSMSTSTENTPPPSLSTWKDRGDALLRLGDASSAASYYERALYESSHVSTGSTIILSIQGFPKVAEVDCVDEDEDTGKTSLDVTIVETGEEMSVMATSVLLGILNSDPDMLQERILLNLARCMLQLADLVTSANSRSKYLKAAVLATTLVITIASFRQEEECDDANFNNTPSSNAQTGLILRIKAQSGLSKWANAMADAKQLVKAGNEQGTKLVATLERRKKQLAKTNKKLAKEMCKLVESTTSSGSVSSNKSDAESPDFSHPSHSSPTKPHPASSPTLSSFSIADVVLMTLWVATAVLIAQFAPNLFKSDNNESRLSE